MDLRLGLLVLAVSVGRVDAGPLVLVEKGAPRAVIRLPAQPDANETLAAKELQAYLKKITGAEVPIGADDASLTLELGGAIPERPKVAASPEGFVIVAQGNRIRLAGTTSAGTLFAVYEFLERLGCRWFMPGEMGEVVAKTNTVAIEPFSVAETPDFESRRVWYSGSGTHHTNIGIAEFNEWCNRQKLGGVRQHTGHNWAGLVSSKLFMAHPEYFSVVGGGRARTQLCTTNPSVLHTSIASVRAMLAKDPSAPMVSLSPNDGFGFCECGQCRALDPGLWDTYAGSVDISDRLAIFFNSIAQAVERDWPDKRLAFYTYVNYLRPPLRQKLHENLLPAVCPITLCRFHSVKSPVCAERRELARLMTQWTKLADTVYYREYNFNLAGSDFPYSKWHTWRDDIPFFKQLGVKGFSIETFKSWATNGPHIYLCARLLWKADQPVDAILDDYCAKFFGPAAAPMKSYFQRQTAAFEQGDHHTGNACCLPHFCPEPYMKAALTDLEQAAQLTAGDEMLSRRVQMVRMGHEYLQAFLDMRKHQDALNFVEAKRCADEVYRWIERMVEAGDAYLLRGLARAYLKRYWRPTIDAGYACTTGGNEMAVALPDAWRFKTDPDGSGERRGYASLALPDADWRLLRTFSQSWGDQGLGHYFGAAWYRTSVTMPASFRGRTLRLWFGGVDESAKVFVNGRPVGEHTGYGPPFEFDVTEAVKLGQPNLIAVKVSNIELNELGSGGLWKPAMIYAAAKESGQK